MPQFSDVICTAVLFNNGTNKWMYRVQMESYVRYSVPFNIDKNENDYNDMETLTLRFFFFT